jgi:hypothetical protein
MVVGGQRQAPVAFLLGQTWWRLSRSQGWSGWVQKISPSLGFNLWPIQPIVSWYTELG